MDEREGRKEGRRRKEGRTERKREAEENWVMQKRKRKNGDTEENKWSQVEEDTGRVMWYNRRVGEVVVVVEVEVGGKKPKMMDDGGKRKKEEDDWVRSWVGETTINQIESIALTVFFGSWGRLKGKRKK